VPGTTRLPPPLCFPCPAPSHTSSIDLYVSSLLSRAATCLPPRLTLPPLSSSLALRLTLFCLLPLPLPRFPPLSNTATTRDNNALSPPNLSPNPSYRALPRTKSTKKKIQYTKYEVDIVANRISVADNSRREAWAPSFINSDLTLFSDRFGNTCPECP